MLDVRSDLPPALDDVVRRAMAIDPNQRFPSAGDLGEAALIAAGGRGRARAESVVATGEAAPVLDEAMVGPLAAVPSRSGVLDGAHTRHADVVRWAIALAGLVIVAVGVAAALRGISTL
jgi:hypothetical protein